MILNLIKKLLKIITDAIFSVVDFPVVPAGLVSAVQMMLDYMKQGMGIFNFFIPLTAVKPALIIFLSVWGVLHGYKLLMWVLRKIPMLGIK